MHRTGPGAHLVRGGGPGTPARGEPIASCDTRRTGSGECVVGRIASVDEDITLSTVDPNARVADEADQISIANIIAIDWDTDYLGALDALLASEVS